MWSPMLLHRILFVMVGLLLAGPVCAAELTGTVRWSGEVRLAEPTVLMPAATLTVAPGTRVTVTDQAAKLSIRGVLTVQGTEEAPVVFAAPKGWAGIEFMEAPKGSELRWAQFAGAQMAISSFATDFAVHNSRFIGCEFGIKLLRESAPLVTDSTFEGNGVGITNEMKSGATIRGNSFRGHTQTAVLTSHNSRGLISDNLFEKNKQAVTLLQRYPDRIVDNRFIANETGIYCNQTQNTPVIEGNLFERNGNALVNFSFAYPAVKNNRFIDNETAVRNDQYGSPLLANNLLRGNQTAIYNYRKSNPQVLRNRIEQNELAMFCDFSSYPTVRQNNFLDNVMGVKLGIYQSADWEKRSGSRTIMQREASARQSQNPLLAKAPTEFSDVVDVSENWWGAQNALLDGAGKDGNVSIFHDRRDQPEVVYEGYGPESYRLDRIRYLPRLEAEVGDAGPKESP